MKKTRIILEIELPEHYSGQTDIRVGWHDGRIVGDQRILNAEMLLKNSVKVREAGEQKPA